jgi:hypothetical protein
MNKKPMIILLLLISRTIVYNRYIAMEAGQSSQYSEKELAEYRGCPEVMFTGSHVAGLRGCIYCAEIYRRYHKDELDRMAALKEAQ